jgi:hypothetical protein
MESQLLEPEISDNTRQPNMGLSDDACLRN